MVASLTDSECSENIKIPERRKFQKCNKFCIFFKLPLFLLCLSIFVYQANDFIKLYWSYPEVIDKKLETERDIILPAFTFCESNSALRIPFCYIYGESCRNATSEDDICKAFPLFCRYYDLKLFNDIVMKAEDHLLPIGKPLFCFVDYYRRDGVEINVADTYSEYGMPIPNQYGYFEIRTQKRNESDHNIAEDHEQKLQHEKPGELVTNEAQRSAQTQRQDEKVDGNYEGESGSGQNDEEGDENYAYEYGPAQGDDGNVKRYYLDELENQINEFFHVSESVSHEILKCYSINSHVRDSKYPSQMKLDRAAFLNEDGLEILKLRFKFHMDHVNLPLLERGVYFQIHSPFFAVNPTESGILLKPGTSNRFHVHLEEEHLLPFPYSTDCINYTSQWERRGRTGFRSQEMCILNCQIYFKMMYTNCAPPWIPHPHIKDALFCVESWDNLDKRPLYRNLDTSYLEMCIQNCKPNCMSYKYHYTQQERKYQGNIGKNPRMQYTEVTVTLNKPEILLVKHRPLFQMIEVFSYIGGLLACWFGISLFSFADIIENTIYIIKYYFVFSKKSKASEV